jgi:hypothetical protein
MQKENSSFDLINSLELKCNPNRLKASDIVTYKRSYVLHIGTTKKSHRIFDAVVANSCFYGVVDNSTFNFSARL